MMMCSLNSFAYKIGDRYDEARGLDTLITHPNYPPITYKRGEYHFLKYTAKYIPESLIHSFKILATCGDQRLGTFMRRTEEQVIEYGMWDEGVRLRKEFCLEGYSSFVNFFHKRGIYYPYAMKTYILLSFHQYLNQKRIRWRYNKKISLFERKELNQAWKDRLDGVFEPIILDEEPPDFINRDHLDSMEMWIYTY
mgnify:CR=1 FL=1